jgi:BASS family bile acid:Na+ symporter
MELMQAASSVALLVFVIAGMLDLGLGLTLREVLDSLRGARRVGLALFANFVLMPAAALGLAWVLRLDRPLGLGLLLLGASAGAPFLPMLAQAARGNLAYAAGLMVLLMVLSVAYLPLVLPVLAPGIAVDPAQIARSLVLLMLLPLAVAGIVRARAPALAARLKPPLGRLSRLSLILLVVLMLVTSAGDLLALFGTRGVLASLLFVAAGFACGWLLGGPGEDTRRVLALATSSRNFAAALVVARSLADPKVEVLIVVVALVSLLTLIPVARRLAKRSTP